LIVNVGVPELRPFYDVIVVGAGSAGAVVAQTLAALLPLKSILVIESGPNLDTMAPVSQEPANSPNLFVAQSDGRRQQPPQAFTRQSAPRPGKAQVPNLAAPPFPLYIQGRGWGGTGAINGLICAPGKPVDYDRWAHEYGCTGWSWADLTPVFTELQSHLFISTPPMYQAADEALLVAHTSLKSNQLRLTPAALSVSTMADLSPKAQTTRQSAAISSPEDRPSTRSLQTTNGVVDARASFEPQAESVSLRRKLLGLTQHHPSNLHVLYGINVVRILTDDRITWGVQLADGTEVETTHVVLSAGAIGSPVLLQRSGIGRPSVGQNLHDHVSVSVTLQLRNTPSEGHVPSGQPPDEKPTPTNVVIESSNHIQILPVSPLPNEPNLGVWMASPFQAIHGRGSVTTQSDGATLVQFDSFSDERDRSQLRDAARLLGQLLEQLHIAPGTQIAATPVDPHLAEKLRTLSDDELDTWVLNNQGSYYHAAGTCRMGAVDDPRSVVDPTCAVLGWSNISVIDASIFPDLPTANPYLPTVAVAQLAATRLATRLRA
jgi:5-(hydroxymethyl)furfural/furfural oxidase